MVMTEIENATIVYRNLIDTCRTRYVY